MATGWKSMSLLTVAGDLSGDGRTDLVAPAGRVNADRYADLRAITNRGEVRTYYSRADGFTHQARVASGWTSFNHVSANDHNRDGRPELVGRTRAGVLYTYTNRGTGYSASVVSGRGWNGLRVIA